MSEGLSIPEMLGFKAVPFEREKLYTAQSYQALYHLTEEEAREVRESHGRHSSVDLALSKRYMNDAGYRARVDKACEDISDTEPDEETKRIMRRLMQSMKAPSEEAGRAAQEIVGELPEDSMPEGAA